MDKANTRLTHYQYKLVGKGIGSYLLFFGWLRSKNGQTSPVLSQNQCTNSRFHHRFLVTSDQNLICLEVYRSAQRLSSRHPSAGQSDYSADGCFALGIAQPSSVHTPPSSPITVSGWSSIHAFCSTSRNTSLGCAPEIAYLRLMTKNGTPLTPICWASRSSPRTSSAKSPLIGPYFDFHRETPPLL